LFSLADNASLGSWGNRWDVRGIGGAGAYDAIINLNGFTLTKVGPGLLYAVDATVTNSGNINVSGGFLGFARCRVEGPGTITVGSGAILSFESSSVGDCLKPIIVNNGTIRNTANPFTLWSPITNVSGLVLDIQTQPLTLTNIITGAGGVTKISSNTATLQALNDYLGPTTISGGTLALGTNATLPNSPTITVGAGAVFDVTSPLASSWEMVGLSLAVVRCGAMCWPRRALLSSPAAVPVPFRSATISRSHLLPTSLSWRAIPLRSAMASTTSFPLLETSL
jgi:autotransporter-associated beta strand protein